MTFDGAQDSCQQYPGGELASIHYTAVMCKLSLWLIMWNAAKGLQKLFITLKLHITFLFKK